MGHHHLGTTWRRLGIGQGAMEEDHFGVVLLSCWFVCFELVLCVKKNFSTGVTNQHLINSEILQLRLPRNYV